MNTHNPAYGIWPEDDDFHPTVRHAPDYDVLFGKIITFNHYSLDDNQTLHHLSVELLKSVISNDNQFRRIWKKITRICESTQIPNKQDHLIIEWDIAILQPILQEEELIPKDMSEADAINWLVANCCEIKVKEEAAAK